MNTSTFSIVTGVDIIHNIRFIHKNSVNDTSVWFNLLIFKEWK
jgi:hypothetical protein